MKEINNEDPKEKLKKVLSQAKDLPTLPSIATNALQLMNNPRTSMKDLGRVIGSDQSITSKLLRMVNSAYYGFPRRISTISQALVVIGVEGLRSLIMGLSVQSMFTSDIGRTLWGHSVSTAASARLLTQKFGNVHPEESFVVGLIHDIGRLILFQNFPEEFKYFNLIEKDSINTLKEERDYFGMDHGEIGSKIGINWNLPQKIIDAIHYHHKPNMVPQNQVVYIVNLAESIAVYIHDSNIAASKKLPVPSLEDYVIAEYLEKLRIKEIPEQMIIDIKDKTSELMEVFGSN